MKKQLANTLSTSRIVMSGGIGVTAALQEWRWALWLFVAAVLSDMIDGPLARLLKTTSKTGHLLDRLGDGALLAGTFSGLTLGGVIPWLIAGQWLIGTMLGFVLAFVERRLTRRKSVSKKEFAVGAIAFSALLLASGIALAIKAYGWHMWYVAAVAGIIILAAATKGRRLR